jgi:hypothetical protein
VFGPALSLTGRRVSKQKRKAVAAAVCEIAPTYAATSVAAINDQSVPDRVSSFFASAVVLSLRCFQFIATDGSIYSRISIFFH